MTQEERAGMLQVISDLSKDATGCRVRWNYEAMSDQELQDSWDYFIRELEASQIRESQMKLAAQKVWEYRINYNLLKVGAENRAQALRWDIEAYDVDGDLGYYCYLNGLDYALEHRIAEEACMKSRWAA